MSFCLRCFLPLVLWHCWLGSRKGIRLAKTEWWGAGVVICLEWGADLHMAQLMPLPLTVSCFSKIQIGFTFLVPAHPASTGQRVVKWVCVCVSVSGRNSFCWQKLSAADTASSFSLLYELVSVGSWRTLWVWALYAVSAVFSDVVKLLMDPKYLEHDA